MPSSEISRLARLWLDGHEDDAVALARDMVAELQESGNDAGADMWRRVIIAIEELRKAEGGRGGRCRS